METNPLDDLVYFWIPFGLLICIGLDMKKTKTKQVAYHMNVLQIFVVT